MCQESVERHPEGECGAFEIGIPPNIPIRPYHQDRNLHDFRKENQDSLTQTLPIEEGILPRLWCCAQGVKRSNSRISLNDAI